MKISLKKIMVFESVFIAFTLSSYKMREMFYGHTIYYSLGILFIFIGLFLFFHMTNLGKKIKSNDNKILKIRYWVTFGFLCLFILLCSTNGISGISIFGLPFIAGIFAERILDDSKKILSRDNIIFYVKVVFFAIMVFAGLKVLAFFQGDIVAGYADAYSSFSPKGEWMDNVRKIVMSWLAMFGVEDISGTNFMEVNGILNILKILISLLIAVIPIIATCCYKNLKSHMRIFICIHWAVTAIISVGFIFGGLGAAEWRIIPAMSTAVIVSILFINYSFSIGEALKRISVLMSLAIGVFSVISVGSVLKTPADNYKDNYLFELTDTLKEHNLTYGYATFWRANAITVISGSDVKVRDVNINENGVSMRWYMSSSEWYKDQPDVDKYFILVDGGELDYILNSSDPKINVITDEITTSINGQNYFILVYDHNIV